MAKGQPRPANKKWEKHKEEIVSLYQETTLDNVIEQMKQRHEFCASESQYTAMFKLWGIRKNRKTRDWRYIDNRIRKRRSEGKASDVFQYGKHIPHDELERKIARYVTFTDRCYDAEVQDAPTPDGLSIRTPPESMVFPPENRVVRIDNLPWLLFNQEVQSQAILYRNLSGSTLFTAEEPSDIFAWPTHYIGLESLEASYAHQHLVPSSIDPSILDFRNWTFDLEGMIDPLPDIGSAWDFLEHQVYEPVGSNADLIFTPLYHAVHSAFLWVSLQKRTGESGGVKSLEPLYKSYIVEDNRIEYYPPSRRNTQGNLTCYPTVYQLFSLFIFMVTNNLLNMELFMRIYAWADLNRCSWIFKEVLRLKSPTADIFATKLLPAAVRVGDIELVHELFSRNVAIDTPIESLGYRKHFRTALSLAVAERNLQMVKALCDLGATPKVLQIDIRAVNGIRESLWSSENLGILSLLLDYGADPERLVADKPRGFPLIDAASKGSVEAVSQLLAAGANVNLSISFVDSGLYGTALQAAAERGNLQIVRALIEARADVNMVATVSDDLGNHRSYACGALNTPIQLAAEANNAEIVLLLLQCGAWVNFCPVFNVLGLRGIEDNFAWYEKEFMSNGTRPFAFAVQYAAQNENIPLVHQLLAAGSIVDSRIGIDYGDTPLQIAARLGNLELVCLLLKHNADVNAPPGKYNGRTAIQAAAESGNIAIIQMLLDARANVNALPGWRRGRTALQAAIEKGHINAARHLLLARADINAKPAFSRGLTALQAAVLYGNVEIVKEILGYGALVNAAAGPEVGTTALQAALFLKNLDLLDLLLQSGADVNELSWKDRNMTALQFAVRWEWLEGVKLLLNYDPDVRTLRYEGPDAFSALGLAICAGNLDLIVLLLDSGAGPNDPVVNFQGGPHTAFHLALISPKSYEIIQLFVERGADINQCWGSQTALEVAIGVNLADGAVVRMMIDLISRTTGNHHSDTIKRSLASLKVGRNESADIDLIRLLLDAGADINAIGIDDKATVLQRSVRYGYMKAVEFLLQNGAEVNIPANKTRGTPLQEAIQYGEIESADLLIYYGADVNAAPAEKEGVTALQAAAIHNYNPLAVKLLERGADVNAAPAPISGRTAIDGAAEHGHLEMLQLLLNAYGDREGLSSVCTQAASLAEKEGHAGIAVWLRSYAPQST